MTTNLKIWKTIEVGALPPGGLLSELEKEGHYVSSWAKELIEKMPLGKIEKVDVVKMTLAEMGFTKPARWVQILEKVKELGGDFCPELGPLLRLADKDQEKGSWYYIAMEPIAGSGGRPFVFYVGRFGGGGRWLHAFWVLPDDEWDLDHEFVFRLRKENSGTENSALDSKTLALELVLEITEKLNELKNFI